MSHALVLGLGAIVSWLIWEIAGDGILKLVAHRLRPMARPLWLALVNARWSWPLLAVIPLGVASMIEGYALLGYLDGRADFGVGLFFGGAGAALSALILWSEARRVAAGNRPPR